MKKRNMKKGFTLVELVIVIAVIAILAGVLIPTFGGIITKANASACQQEASNIYREILALDLTDGKIDQKDGELDIELDDYCDTDEEITYTHADGKLTKFVFKCDNGYTATFENNKWSVAETQTEPADPGQNNG